MPHKRPRGHSNVYANETEIYKCTIDRKVIVQPDVASIPLTGGSSVESCKPLPPLSLRQEEWKTIGLKMGWIKDN